MTAIGYVLLAVAGWFAPDVVEWAQDCLVERARRRRWQDEHPNLRWSDWEDS